jgi:hypothetical protein
MKVGGRACTPLLHEQVAQEEMCLYTVKKTSVSHQEFHQPERNGAGGNYQSDGKINLFPAPTGGFFNSVTLQSYMTSALTGQLPW